MQKKESDGGSSSVQLGLGLGLGFRVRVIGLGLGGGEAGRGDAHRGVVLTAHYSPPTTHDLRLTTYYLVWPWLP